MPSALTYPGVYIEEISSGVRTITGVSTSVTAFVGYTARGPVDRAVRIFNYGGYEREFGGLHRDSDVSYAVQQFFLNGGSDAYVVRVASGAKPATVVLKDAATQPATVLEVTAASPGVWGNDVWVNVDYATADARNLFNLFVSRVDPVTQTKVDSEEFRNLSMNSKSNSYAVNVVNATSRLIRLAPPATTPFSTADKGFSVSGDVSQVALGGNATYSLTVSVDGGMPATLTLAPSTNTGASAIEQLFDAAINNQQWSGLEAVVSDANGGTTGPPLNHVMLRSTSGGEHSSVMVTPGPVNDASHLLNVGRAEGGTEVEGASFHRPQIKPPVALSGGSDGTLPTAAEYMGSPSLKTGIYALRDVDLFNLLCIPGTARLTDPADKSVLQAAVGLCEEERAFLIIDPPGTKNLTNIETWATSVTSSRNAAVYWPRIVAADPLDGFRLREMPASGAIAGIMARTDAERGVWKAPAGTEAVLRGTQGLAYNLTDPENGTLNPKGVNSLRTFPVYGRVVWGARTRKGDDAQADDYKYIPVRRLALYLEETLFRSTQWVVFEPNDEPLWSQIRLNIGSFMHGLFRQGAFQGNTPAKAYLVKCDSETTTQYDIDRGIVNILVAFAPLKPAEFVVIKIQQKAQVPA